MGIHQNSVVNLLLEECILSHRGIAMTQRKQMK